ncbi:hypothetical protein BVD86_09395 [Acinetobacter pittii]|nr:hypothetical protein BVD86_09395 [Acinetobacter pittii]MDB0115677.1 hypothetical protein [Acinetobacter baumannii]
MGYGVFFIKHCKAKYNFIINRLFLTFLRFLNMLITAGTKAKKESTHSINAGLLGLRLMLKEIQTTI